MIGLYTSEVPEYHFKQFQLVQTLKQELPFLFKHLDRLKIDLSMFTCEWIMTLFQGTWCYNYSMALLVLDSFISVGWQAVYSAAVSLFKSVEQDLMLQKDIVGVNQVMQQVKLYKG